MKRTWLASAITLVSLVSPALSLSHTAMGEEVNIANRPTITVQGTGNAGVAPDIVFITIGVETQAKTAVEALAQNTTAMQALFATLQELKIERKNTQTVNFNVSPVYGSHDQRYDPNNPPETKVVGYRVSNQVRIKSTDIGGLGKVLDGVVSAGANTIQGIQFDNDKADGAMDEARKNAVKDARRRAELLAEAAGCKLGRAIQINDHSQSHPPMPMARMAMMADSSVPIAEGEQQLNANITVVFELLTAE